MCLSQRLNKCWAARSDLITKPVTDGQASVRPVPALEELFAPPAAGQGLSPAPSEAVRRTGSGLEGA